MNETVLRIDSSNALGRVQRLDSGGARIPANLTRTGVFTYRQPDGTVRRELRLPDEVFKADSLATYKGAPVTSGHPGLVSTTNWREVAVGHTEDVKQDGEYISGDLVIHDAGAIGEIEGGSKREVSCGYRCRMDYSPGEYEGEKYDAIQRDIKINHVALVPRGRAGATVALRLDEMDAVCVDDEQQETKQPMSEKVLIKLDGKDVDFGGREHIAHLETRADAAEKMLQEAKSEADKAAARADAAEEKAKELEAKLAEATDQARLDAAVQARSELVAVAREACGSEFKADGLSDRDLKIAVISASRKEFKADGKSDDYIEAAFEFARESGVRADGITGATAIKAQSVVKTDSVDEARQKMIQYYRNAHCAEGAK